MTKNDIKRFSEMWLSAYDNAVGSKMPSNSAISLAFEILQGFDLDCIKRAVIAHATQSRFGPTPADLISIMVANMPKHIDADEAWSIVIKSMDENETVVMTKEIAEARCIAMDVWADGDKVGARMAFRKAYERIIEGKPAPVWFVSEGWSKEGRKEAVEKAIQLGRLPANCADKYYLDEPMPKTIKAITGKTIALELVHE